MCMYVYVCVDLADSEYELLISSVIAVEVNVNVTIKWDNNGY